MPAINPSAQSNLFRLLFLSDHQSKTQKCWYYHHRKLRKLTNIHSWETVASEFLAFWVKNYISDYSIIKTVVNQFYIIPSSNNFSSGVLVSFSVPGEVMKLTCNGSHLGSKFLLQGLPMRPLEQGVHQGCPSDHTYGPLVSIRVQ